MGFHLGRALTGGIKRVLTRTGGILLVGLFVLQLLSQASINTAIAGAAPEDAGFAVGLTLPVSATVAGVLIPLLLLVSAVYFVVLSRAFSRPLRELSSFPSSLYTRRIGRAARSQGGGGARARVALTLGLVLLLLPGLFLAACFLFFAFAVSVEDRGFIDGLKRSWDLSRGNRLKLGIIVVVSGAIGAAIGMVGTVFEVAGLPVVADLAAVTITSLLYVPLWGIIASAYLQLVDAESGGTDRTGTGDPLGTGAD